MKRSHRASLHGATGRSFARGLCLTICAVAMCATMLVPTSVAHSPVVDADLDDWCLGATSNGFPAGGRTEDSYAELTCGNCSTDTNLSCQIDTDCPGAQTCVNLTSRVESVWWDNRTDGAINDLATLALTQDNTNLYIAAQLWVDPDPVSLPFGEVAIDYTSGGLSEWHDPNGALTVPGSCSGFTDRACTSDADCAFCQISTEPFPSTRVRACGSACDPDIGDVCDTSQTCVGLGTLAAAPNVGGLASPDSSPDHLILFDFSRWLVGLTDATMVMEIDNGAWSPIPGAVVLPAVDPGASGGSGGPPGKIETAIPWSFFGCTGCPGACSCPGFGPGQDFRFTIMVARGSLSLDYSPDGAIEDVQSEAVAGTTTVSQDSCAGMGIGTTACELADGSSDGFVPPAPVSASGGETDGLLLDKVGGNVSLSWNASCSVTDTDYEVYEGTIGSYASHIPVAGLCSTAGATSASFAPAGGDVYYLIASTDGATEGSIGRSSDGTERAIGAAPCKPRAIGVCQ